LRSKGFALALLASTAILAGCRQDMHDAPRYEAFEATSGSPDNRSERTPPAGTVARGWLRDDEALYTGKINGQTVDQFPFAIGREELTRGQQRFNIYCTPCHGRLGDGQGMVVQRGLRRRRRTTRIACARKSRLLLRRDHERLRRHAGLRGTDSGPRSLADRRLRAHAAIEPACVGRGRARGSPCALEPDSGRATAKPAEKH
jgi:hypothetical protein